MIKISRNDIILAKDNHPENKLSTFYKPNPYIVAKVYKRSAKIKNGKGEYVWAKAHIKVLQGDKIKVNIQGSEKPVVTQANIISKPPYPLHIPYHIPFVPDQVEQNASEDLERVNSEDKSSISEGSDATLTLCFIFIIRPIRFGWETQIKEKKIKTTNSITKLPSENFLMTSAFYK